MIFCVEDDRNIRELVVYTLESMGMRARGLENGIELKKALVGELPRLILLDIMLPGEGGIQLLKQLKQSSNTKDIPVIMMTAKSEEYDKVKGLDSGADDYVTKPFGVMELVSRIKAVLRRVDKTKQVLQQVYEIGLLKLNVEKHVVKIAGEKIALTYKEFELLELLIRNPNIVLSRQTLLERVWGYDFDGETRTVDVHIRTLRQKLGIGGKLIETIRGVGYCIGGENED